MLKRIGLFLLTNLLVVVTVGIILSILQNVFGIRAGGLGGLAACHGDLDGGRVFYAHGTAFRRYRDSGRGSGWGVIVNYHPAVEGVPKPRQARHAGAEHERLGYGH